MKLYKVTIASFSNKSKDYYVRALNTSEATTRALEEYGDNLISHISPKELCQVDEILMKIH